MIGMFNLNNVGVEIRSPLRDYFMSVDSLPSKFKKPAVQTLAPIIKLIVEKYQQIVENPDSDG